MTNEITLGSIDLRVKADAKSFEAAQKKGGEAAGKSFSKNAAVAGAGVSPRTKNFPPPSVAGAFGGAALSRARNRGAKAGVLGRTISAAGGVGAGAATAAAIALPILAGAAIAGGVLVALAVGVKKVVGLLNSESRRLAGLNLSLATAAIERNVGQLLRDIDRARVIGPTMLRISRSMENVRNRLAPIGNVLLLKAARGLELFAKVLDNASIVIAATLGTIIDSTTLILTKIGGFLTSAGPLGGPFFGVGLSLIGIGNLLQDIKKELRNLNDGQDDPNINRIFVQQLDVLAGGGIEPLLLPPARIPNP